ncbi:DoxX family protein [Brevibacillus dissolubilis]|uniref:DoxX family protein n=1 Tax=Brevibacillus dissolubilis TaxID=1844116 RepID=UPI00159BE52F|nr:DoxX family protein [Brevibacillus dissolubilis]
MNGLIPRILAGGVFAYMGLFKIIAWNATAGWMAMKGLPPSLIPIGLVIAILAELGGGLAILFNFRLKWVATALALFMIPTNIIMHNFWALPPEMATAEQLSFLQNVIIIGGLLAMANTTAKQENGAASSSKAA